LRNNVTEYVRRLVTTGNINKRKIEKERFLLFLNFLAFVCETSRKIVSYKRRRNYTPMHQGYNYGNMRMPMPQTGPQYTPQAGPGMPANRPPYNMNANINFGGRSQTDTVMSKLSSQLDQADQSELQELHDKEEKVHQLLNENSEVYQLPCQLGCFII
jgi:hypothetical protein